MTDLSTPVVIKKKRHSPIMRFRIRRRVAANVASPERHDAALARFRSSLEGALPDRSANGTILAACDEYYYRHFALSMLRSIEKLGQEQAFHLHLCAPSAETRSDVETLRRSLRAVRLSWTADDGTFARLPLYPTIHFAGARFLLADAILDKTEAPVLCLDIDGIAMKPIWPSFEVIRRNSDVVVIKRPLDKDPGRKVLASALGINPTEKGRSFARILACTLAEIIEMRPHYHVDQITIHYLIERLEAAGLRTTQMPSSLADFEFAEDSVIWTAKGWHRKHSRVYTDAMARMTPGADDSSSHERREV